MNDPILLQWIYLHDLHQIDAPCILIDRLWPHGRSRSELGIDHWWPEAAPSSRLKRHLTQERLDWPRFARQYRDELHTHAEKTRRFIRLAQQLSRQQKTLVLVTHERHPEESWPEVLHEFLLKSLRKEFRSYSA